MNILAAGKPFDAEYTRRSNEINAKIDDIIKLDDEGKVAGQILEVPVYNQYDTFPHDYRNELCWATCQAMMSSYYLGDTIDRTQSVASYTRAFIEYFWGSPISYNESFHWIKF